MSTVHEYDPTTVDDPFSPQYWGDLIEVKNAERTPIYSLPTGQVEQAAKVVLRSLLISLNNGEVLPVDMTDGFRFHPESCQPGVVIVYDVEKVVRDFEKGSSWAPARKPKNKLDDIALVENDTFDLLCLAPAGSLRPFGFRLTKHTMEEDTTLTTATYSREVGIGIVLGDEGRRALMTYDRDPLIFWREQPGYRWLNKNDPGIVGFSTKRATSIFGQPQEIVERVRSIKHFEGSRDYFDSVLALARRSSEVGSIALK